VAATGHYGRGVAGREAAGVNLPQTLPARLDVLLDRLTLAARALGRKEVRRMQGDSYMATCPGHDDKNPSLSIKLEPNRILCHCFAGCELDDIITAVGFPAEALFDDYKQLDSRPWPTLGKRVNGQTYEHEHASLALPAPECEARIPLPPSLTAFQGLTYPPINPILGPWASQQINLVFAPSGAGKTMFGLSLAYAMAEGEDFLGWKFHGEPRTVLAVELPAEEILTPDGALHRRGDGCQDDAGTVRQSHQRSAAHR